MKKLIFAMLITGAAYGIGNSPPPPDTWWDTPVSQVDNCQALNVAGITPQSFMNAAGYAAASGNGTLALTLAETSNLESQICGWDNSQDPDMSYLDQLNAWIDQGIQNFCDQYGCG